MSEVELQGMDHFLRELNRLSTRSEKVENEAVKAGAGVLKKTMQTKAPRSAEPRKPIGARNRKSQTWRTGEHFSDNIKISGIKRDYGVKFVNVGITGRGDSSKYFYAKFLEYGTSKLTARPFMRPAYEESKKEILDTMASVVKKELGL